MDLQEKFPVARKVTMDSFFLGTFIGITDEHLNYVENAVDEFMESMLEV